MSGQGQLQKNVVVGDGEEVFEYDLTKEMYHKQARLTSQLRGTEANFLVTTLLTLFGLFIVVGKNGLLAETQMSGWMFVGSLLAWLYAASLVVLVVFPRRWMGLPRPNELFDYLEKVRHSAVGKKDVNWIGSYKQAICLNYKDLADRHYMWNKSLQIWVPQAKFILVVSALLLGLAIVSNGL